MPTIKRQRAGKSEHFHAESGRRRRAEAVYAALFIRHLIDNLARWPAVYSYGL
jgi:hypothetical protein